MKVKVKKNPGRKRRAAGWTLLTLGLLVAGVWGASQRWRLTHVWPDNVCFNVEEGRVFIFDFRALSANFWVAGWHLTDAREWYRAGKSTMWPNLWPNGDVQNWGVGLTATGMISGQSTTVYGVYLWPFVLFPWVASLPLLRSASRARRLATAGLCGGCGYSLAGLAADAPCPECGKNKASYG